MPEYHRDVRCVTLNDGTLRWFGREGGEKKEKGKGKDS
jgi:hypothetical protein